MLSNAGDFIKQTIFMILRIDCHYFRILNLLKWIFYMNYQNLIVLKCVTSAPSPHHQP